VTDNKDKLTYEDAGYNRFFRRTLNSNPGELRLKDVGASRQYAPRDINFDALQTSGALGDKIKVGNVTIDGNIGVRMHDAEGNEVVRIGDAEA